ncbi:MAG: flippase-like domain-containing protein [Ignavibacteriae bacterium]|nr:flippase-like domain-containing protein [Ignavibacteriota bacterium]
MFSKYKKKILVSIAFGAVIYLAFSIYADLDKLLAAFGDFNWLWLPLILSLSFMNYIFRFLKWQYYLYILDIRLSRKESFLIFLSALTMSVTPGKMGEVLKSYLLKEENGTPVSKSAPIVLAERLTDFVSIVLLCILGSYVYNYGQAVIIIIGIVFILTIVLLSMKNLSLNLINLLSKIGFLKKHIDKINIAYESIYLMIKIKPLIIATFISLISWFFECIGFFIVLNAFSHSGNMEISLLSATFIYAFSTLIGAVAMLPGGVGITEASLTGLLVFSKISKDISVASTLIIRLATLWFAVFVGIISVFLFQRLTNKKIENLGIENSAEK